MKNRSIVSFGHYPTSADGSILEPITWIVLSQSKEKTLLLSEKILDRKEYAQNGSNSWEESDLRRWLEEDFLPRAFSEEEQARLSPREDGRKVSLLTVEDYFNKSYFPTLKSLKAPYTDYAKEKTRNRYGKLTSYEFGFWWLRSPNTDFFFGAPEDFDKSIYVFHVCHSGKLNGFMLAKNVDGVRPVIELLPETPR